jgi:transposase, IS30 family
MKCTYSQIDMEERRKIARWRMAGLNVEIKATVIQEHPC